MLSMMIFLMYFAGFTMCWAAFYLAIAINRKYREETDITGSPLRNRRAPYAFITFGVSVVPIFNFFVGFFSLCALALTNYAIFKESRKRKTTIDQE